MAMAINSVNYKERKGKWDSILNLSKSKRKIMKLLSVDDSIFLFHLYDTLVIHTGSGMAAKAYQNFLCPSFVIIHNAVWTVDAWIVALLWKFPQMPSSSANNANLDKHNFDMFYKIYCCAAIHFRIWMINVLLKWKYNNYVIMHWNKFCYMFLRFWEILSQTRVSFLFFKLTLYIHLYKHLFTLLCINISSWTS